MAGFKQITMGFEPEYESKEELLFSSYVSELLEGGWLKKATYQPSSFVLSQDKFVFAYVKKKNTNELVDVKLTRGSVYTADWKLVWDKKSKGVFTWVEGGSYNIGFYPYRKARASSFIPFYATTIDHELTSYVDIKGTFPYAPGLATFSAQQKWLMSRETFIQKIVVSLDIKGIFAKTFFPRSVVAGEIYKTDREDKIKGGYKWRKGDSKIKVEIRLIEHFIKNKA